MVYSGRAKIIAGSAGIYGGREIAVDIERIFLIRLIKMRLVDLFRICYGQGKGYYRLERIHSSRKIAVSALRVCSDPK